MQRRLSCFVSFKMDAPRPSQLFTVDEVRAMLEDLDVLDQGDSDIEIQITLAGVSTLQ